MSSTTQATEPLRMHSQASAAVCAVSVEEPERFNMVASAPSVLSLRQTINTPFQFESPEVLYDELLTIRPVPDTQEV
jgi:hypothetical protein